MPKEQHEEEAILRFASYLEQETGVAFGVTGRDVPVPSGQNYDYELTGTDGSKLAVELFRLVESEENIKQSRSWSRVAQKLKEELLGRRVKGYMISTPVFQYKKKEMAAYVTQQADVIERAIKTDEGRTKFSTGGYEFNKITNLETVVFSNSPGARAINPHGTAFEHFSRLLPVKNGQLAVQGRRRALVVVNWAMFVDADSAVQALTHIAFRQFTNIDVIFYEITPGEFVVIFDRSVYEAVGRRTAIADAGSAQLLNRNLRYMLADRNEEAFQFVKAISDAAGSMQWLDDCEARTNVVMYAEYQIKEHKSLKEALWVLDILQDEPNPDSAGANDPGDQAGEYNYHSKVLRNEDIRFITTVRGHLCWLMSHLIVQNTPELYARIIEILERYAQGANLYIRAQTTFPLAELVTRRRAVRNQDGSAFKWSQEERLRVRRLAFEMLRDNSAHPRVMEHLLHVFNSLRDVNEAEAEEILTRFLATEQDYVLHNLAALVVYFALFRHRDWPNDPPFRSRRFVELLKDQIVNGDKSIRASIAWHLWAAVRDKHLPYDEVKEYFPLFWDGTYDSHLTSTCALGIVELTKIAQEDAIALFRRMIRKIQGHADAVPGEHHWLNATEEVIPLLAAQPGELVAVISELKDLWMKGIYIGEPTVIFGTFRRVDPAQRERVKERLRVIYNEMKAANPRFMDINWSD
jgi:hypothetical protein